MFDVGFAEIFLLALIGLIVLGPEKLPAVARTLGGFVRKARTSWYSLRRSIEAEIAEADVAKPLREAASDLQAAGKSVDKSIRDVAEMDMTATAPDPEDKTNKGAGDAKDG
jgi:sec-independent protein translocase protein TatB